LNNVKFSSNFFLPARALQKTDQDTRDWRHSKERNARLFISLSLSISLSGVKEQQRALLSLCLSLSLVSPAFERRAIFLSFSFALPKRGKEREKARNFF